jgi:hypothetical protein
LASVSLGLSAITLPAATTLVPLSCRGSRLERTTATQSLLFTSV